MTVRLSGKHLAPQKHAAGVGLLVRAGILAFVAAVFFAAVSLSHRAEIDAAPPVVIAADPLAADLIRCRSVTPEQLAIDESCRRVWAESRRRFFAPSPSRSDNATYDRRAAPAAPDKRQDRVPSAGVSSDRDGVR